MVTRVAVPVTDAMVGATVTVPTVEGDAEVELRPGTQPGDEYVLRGKGFPALGARGRGDQRVVVEVRVPAGPDRGRPPGRGAPRREPRRPQLPRGRGVLRPSQARLPLTPRSALVGDRRPPRRRRARDAAEACAALGTGCRERDLARRDACARLLGGARPAADPAASRAAGSARAGTRRAPPRRPRTAPGATPCARFHRPVEIAGRLRVRPPWDAAAPAAAGRRDRPGHGLRHRPARHHPGLPGAAGRRCPASRLAARRRVRIGGAGDRGPPARLRPGVGGRPRPAGGRGDDRERAAQRRGPARRPAHD